MIRLFLLLPLLFASIALLAQKTAPNAPVKDTAIARLFNPPTSIKWVKTFKGRLDDASVVDITLASDGAQCRGYLTYPKSKIRLRLEGTFDTSRVRLSEKESATAPVTGHIIATYEKKKLVGDWTNHNNSVGSRLEADEVSPGQTTTLNCSDNKWSSRFVTRYNNARCDMVLVRSQNGALDGFLWVEADAKTYRLKGDITPEGQYAIEVLLPGGKLAAMLQGKLQPGQDTDCNWVGSGERRTFHFKLKDHYLQGCYESADYISQYDVLYPRTPCAACNTWLDQQVDEWIKSCKSVLADGKSQKNAANRAARRAAAWPEIATWTDQVFSGYITFSDTWTPQSRGLSFNFDLKNNKIIELDDLFNKTFSHKTWLADYVKKEMPKLPAFGADPKFRDWLSQSGFPLFALRREGLELSSLFHAQYGRQTLLVPYDQIKPYMRKDNPVAEFVK